MFDLPGGARGPGPEPLQEAEAERILALLHKGRGRALACQELGIGYRRFKRHYDDDEAFRDSVRSAERCAAEVLEAKGYDLALAGDDPAILLKMIGRRDRARQLALARADAAAERESRLRERGKAGGWTLNQVVGFMIRGMSPDQMVEFRDLSSEWLERGSLDEGRRRRFEVLVTLGFGQILKEAQRNTPVAF